MKPVCILLAAVTVAAAQTTRSWTCDNGNGTFTNPLFYDEFSDPDMIRVGEDFYLTGTTMHAAPGLPVLHSKDLVNWKLLSYATEGLDFGPQYRLEDGKSIYGGTTDIMDNFDCAHMLDALSQQPEADLRRHRFPE